jgi:hypothetical protein
VLVLEPGNSPKIRPLKLAPSPLWGVIEEDVLYSYHNPTWNQTNGDPQRQLSRLNLLNGQVKTWTLPNEWDASDLTVTNGKIILAKWDGHGGEEDGLYQFEPEKGQLTKQLLKVADASRLLVSDD